MKWKNLEQEARSFNKSRWVKPTQKAKPLTTRRFLAGQAMSGLIARGQTNMKDIRGIVMENSPPLVTDLHETRGEFSIIVKNPKFSRLRRAFSTF